MIAPSAMMIEAATDLLNNEDYQSAHLNILVAQDKEIKSACPNRSDDFYEGYKLGLETARVMLAGMPAASLAKNLL